MTGARNVSAAVLFACAAGLAGIAPGDGTVRYAIFGAVEGMLALLIAYALAERLVWERPSELTGWLAVAYGALATAQMLEFLLPPPGALEWMVVIGLLFSSWGLFGAGTPRRTLHALAAMAVLLALVRYSVIPLIHSLGPEQGTGLGLGNVAESLRTGLAAQRPSGAAVQLLGVVAAALWALATRLIMPRAPVDTDAPMV